MVSDPLSSNKGSGRDTASLKSYTDTFFEQFPYYLSIGMSEEQYWDRDCQLAKYYREANDLRIEMQNTQSWLMGKYVYDAILCASPILHAFAKKGTKPQPYVDQPYPITRKAIELSKKDREQSSYKKNLAFMEMFMVKNNQSYEK